MHGHKLIYLQEDKGIFPLAYLKSLIFGNRLIDELWVDIGKNRRNMIRKAEKNDVHIIEAKKADLKIFYQLYQITMKKVGSPSQPYKFFEEMWSIFYPQNLKIFLSMYKGRYIAGNLYLLHKDVIYHVYGCSLREYLYLAPNDLLQWNIIKWGNENKFSYINHGRTREGEGTALFKKQWGGEFVKIPYFYKFYKKELKKRQEIQYKWISQLWSRFIPEVIANKIGPWLIKQIR